MQRKSSNEQFTQSVAQAEALMYEAVNALCHGSVDTGNQLIAAAIDTIEQISATPDVLSDQQHATLQDVTARAFKVRSDIADEAKLLRH